MRDELLCHPGAEVMSETYRVAILTRPIAMMACESSHASEEVAP